MSDFQNFQTRYHRRQEESYKDFFDHLFETFNNVTVLITLPDDRTEQISPDACTYGGSAPYLEEKFRVLPVRAVPALTEELLETNLSRAEIREYIDELARKSEKLGSDLARNDPLIVTHFFDSEGQLDRSTNIHKHEYLHPILKKECAAIQKVRSDLCWDFAKAFNRESIKVVSHQNLGETSPYHFEGDVSELLEIICGLVNSGKVISDEFKSGLRAQRFYQDFLKFFNKYSEGSRYSSVVPTLYRKNESVTFLKQLIEHIEIDKMKRQR